MAARLCRMRLGESRLNGHKLDDVSAAMAKEIPYAGAIAAAPPRLSLAERLHASPTATAGGQRCSPTSACTNRSLRRCGLLACIFDGVWSAAAAPAADSIFWAPGWNSIQATNKYQSEIGGPLRGGDPGVRLMEPASPHATWHYFVRDPTAFRADRGRGSCSRFHIFGSEELSRLRPGFR